MGFDRRLECGSFRVGRRKRLPRFRGGLGTGHQRAVSFRLAMRGMGCFVVGNIVPVILPQLDSYVFIDGAGVRFFLGNAKFREAV